MSLAASSSTPTPPLLASSPSSSLSSSCLQPSTLPPPSPGASHAASSVVLSPSSREDASRTRPTDAVESSSRTTNGGEEEDEKDDCGGRVVASVPARDRPTREEGVASAVATTGEDHDRDEDEDSSHLSPAERSARWKVVRDSLTCPLCPSQGFLSYPLTLPCGHTICLSHPSSSALDQQRCPLPSCTFTTNSPLPLLVQRRPDVIVGKLIALVREHDAIQAIQVRRQVHLDTDDDDAAVDGSDHLFVIQASSSSSACSSEDDADEDNPSPDWTPSAIKTIPPDPSSSPPILPSKPKRTRRLSSTEIRSPFSAHASSSSSASVAGAPRMTRPTSDSRFSSLASRISTPRSRAQAAARSLPTAALPTAVRPLLRDGPDGERRRDKELLGLVECDVCTMLLFEPVTTCCGHTFCRKCLARSLEHSMMCPLCRSELAIVPGQVLALNKIIQSILVTAFTAEYEERCLGVEQAEREARMNTPLFICTLAFPTMPTILHIFEPRYRLMIRRCIESPSPRFGMVLPARAGGASEYGTMLEIRSVQMLPDGRSMIETVGSWRFRVKDTCSLDGYAVGNIERFDDISPEDEAELERVAVARGAARRASTSSRGSTSQQVRSDEGAPPFSVEVPLSTTTSMSSTPADTAPAVVSGLIRSASSHSLPPPPPHASSSSPATATAAPSSSFASSTSTPPAYVPLTSNPADLSTAELMATCESFVGQLRSGSAPWLLQRLNNTYGPIPSDPVLCGYWMASVIPIDEYEKSKLLPIRSPRLRLALIVHWVEQLRSSWWFSRQVRRGGVGGSLWDMLSGGGGGGGRIP